VLWRSATPAFVSPEQARALVDELGLGTRVDLRGEAEVAEGTSPALLGAERGWRHLPVRADASAGTFAEAHGVGGVGDYYAAYLRVSGPSVTAAARTLLEDVEAGAGATLVHCTAGKDRTGTVVAVLLDAVGVERAAIVADYAQTTAQMPALRALVTALPTYRERIDRLPAEAYVAAPEAMERFLDLLHAEHGGGRAYLAAAGLDEGELAALDRALLQD